MCNFCLLLLASFPDLPAYPKTYACIIFCEREGLGMRLLRAYMTVYINYVVTYVLDACDKELLCLCHII